MFSTEHIIQDNSASKHIDFLHNIFILFYYYLSIVLYWNLFRSHKQYSSNFIINLELLISFEFCTQSKVYNLYLFRTNWSTFIFHHQNIFRFNVSMDDVILMNVCQPTHNSLDYLRSFFIWEEWFSKLDLLLVEYIIFDNTRRLLLLLLLLILQIF